MVSALPSCFAAQRLVDGAAHGVLRFGRRHDALAARELHAGGEAVDSADRRALRSSPSSLTCETSGAMP